MLTSHAELGDTGKKTGFWLDEFAAPYDVFKDAGAQITLASPLEANHCWTRKATTDFPKHNSRAASRPTLRRRPRWQAPSSCLGVAAFDFDAVFYPGEHGPL